MITVIGIARTRLILALPTHHSDPVLQSIRDLNFAQIGLTVLQRMPVFMSTHSASHDVSSHPAACVSVINAGPGKAAEDKPMPGDHAPPRSNPSKSSASRGGSRVRTEIWDVPFDHLTLDASIDAIGSLIESNEPSYVITANLNYVMLHHSDESMLEITADANLILADGQPIVWRSRLSGTPLPERVAGSEMIFHLAERAASEGWGIYLLGGMPGVADTCADELKRLHPGLIISGVESPPFRELTEQEQLAQDRRIQESGAKLLLVAFGQPKGEKWIHEHHKRMGVPVSIQLGASFDFIAGTATRAPRAFQRVGMEWAYRMLGDPKRLIPRYWSNAVFLTRALLRDWKRTVTRWGMGDWA